MIIVWSPQSCDQDPETLEWVLVELAADATLSAEDVKATGPLRTQRFADVTYAENAKTWIYRGATFIDETTAIAAWQSWDPAAPAPVPEREPEPEPDPEPVPETQP